MQQRPNTIYRIGCQLLRIANTNIYLDTSVSIPVLKGSVLRASRMRSSDERLDASVLLVLRKLASALWNLRS